MHVTCPHCTTRYVLPESLLGPLGARVRCPRCREPFAVTPGGEVSTIDESATETASPAEPMSAAASRPGPPPLPTSAAWTAASATDAALATPPMPISSEPLAQAPLPMAETATPSALATPIEPQQTASPITPPMAPSAFASALSRVREALGGSGAAIVSAPMPAPAAAETPEDIARAVLGELAAHSGEAIATAQAEGRLFAEFGAVITEAYEFYRRRIGSGANPAPFRAALRERWGVDLEPGPPRGADA